MDEKQKKTAGGVVAGCGCFLLLAISAWMLFLLYVGMEGRGNDEEASLMLGAVTCCFSIPVVLLTGAGIFFAVKKPKSEVQTAR
jgi:hypothetical protein